MEANQQDLGIQRVRMGVVQSEVEISTERIGIHPAQNGIARSFKPTELYARLDRMMEVDSPTFSNEKIMKNHPQGVPGKQGKIINKFDSYDLQILTAMGFNLKWPLSNQHQAPEIPPQEATGVPFGRLAGSTPPT